MLVCYVISNEVFSWILMIMSPLFIIYQVTISQVVFGISRLMHVSSISPCSFKEKRMMRDCLTFIPILLINQVFTTCSFTILHGLMQLCFRRVALDLGDFHKEIIASLRMNFKVCIYHF